MNTVQCYLGAMTAVQRYCHHNSGWGRWNGCDRKTVCRSCFFITIIIKINITWSLKIWSHAYCSHLKAINVNWIHNLTNNSFPGGLVWRKFFSAIYKALSLLPNYPLIMTLFGNVCLLKNIWWESYPMREVSAEKPKKIELGFWSGRWRRKTILDVFSTKPIHNLFQPVYMCLFYTRRRNIPGCVGGKCRCAPCSQSWSVAPGIPGRGHSIQWLVGRSGLFFTRPPKTAKNRDDCQWKGGSSKSPNVKFAQFRRVILSAIGPMQCAREGWAFTYNIFNIIDWVAVEHRETSSEDNTKSPTNHNRGPLWQGVSVHEIQSLGDDNVPETFYGRRDSIGRQCARGQEAASLYSLIRFSVLCVAALARLCTVWGGRHILWP